jgi:hexosaminidase
MPVMVHKAVGKLGNLISRYSLYNPAYAAGGNLALLDGLRGSENFSDGRRQGFQGQDLDIVIDLQVPTEIKRISIGLLQQSYSWILMPERVQFWTSTDGKSYSLVKEILNSVDPREDGTIIRDVAADFQGLRARFVRVFGKYPGKLPAWHHAAGNDAFVFADEIVIQ